MKKYEIYYEALVEVEGLFDSYEEARGDLIRQLETVYTPEQLENFASHWGITAESFKDNFLRYSNYDPDFMIGIREIEAEE